jgi:hypothetical protein
MSTESHTDAPQLRSARTNWGVAFGIQENATGPAQHVP